MYLSTLNPKADLPYKQRLQAMHIKYGLKNVFRVICQILS